MNTYKKYTHKQMIIVLDELRIMIWFLYFSRLLYLSKCLFLLLSFVALKMTLFHVKN